MDEISHHKGTILLIRGGEPFLYQPMIDLLSFIKEKNIFVSIDTNGMLLGKYAGDIARLAVDNLVVSIDGPENIHDSVRGARGSFRKIQDGLQALRAAEKRYRISIPKILCFVISPYSYQGLDKIPDVARQLKISHITLVPYYYFCRKIGTSYEKIMREKFNSPACSWRGFHHETSGIDIKKFTALLRHFKKNLKDIVYVPFMDFSEKQYTVWFSNCTKEAKKHTCGNPWALADIQPNGDVNFCVDFPDYIIGSILYNTLGEIWKKERAEKFRAYLQEKSLPICLRCGAQYISG
ncbi:MAG: radical SAM protein [Candidatus Omnitrophica bacterium]|nr:radical SAM protein [Candidatus Omnitrophota bacterium]